MNHKHAKWVEFLQIFTFVMKHINEQAKKVVNALRRRSLIMQDSHVQVFGFDYLKDLYEIDTNLQE